MPKSMLIVSRAKSEADVGTALDLVIKELNEDLERVDGLISGLECDVSVGPIEATVSATVVLDGFDPRRKYLIGVNEKGYSRENSMSSAERKANFQLQNKGGKIAGSFVKAITSLPGRVYTTLILAVNEDTFEGVKDAETRRRRIRKGLELLGNDPSVLNVARLAGVFGVSRTMIYKDLDALGYGRSHD